MQSIKEIYEHFCKTPGDINEHLPTLKKYTEECSHVTEMGARWGCSTFAILSGNPKKFVSYDIKKHENIFLAEQLSEKNEIPFIFKIENVLHTEIEETDLLFIDTWHRYGQLKEELRLHASKVRKWIILHDTETYGEKDEPDWGGLYTETTVLSKEKQGLNSALTEFLEKNPEWKIQKVYKNNNGLTIIERIK